MKACDYVMPDFMRIGAVIGWQRAAAIAAAAGHSHFYCLQADLVDVVAACGEGSVTFEIRPRIRITQGFSWVHISSHAS